MKKNMREIMNRFDEKYGEDPIIYLNFTADYELLIATIMSAQCTDARVNQVTATLFQKYDSLEKFANADQKELEQDIFTTGFYRNKAKNIIQAANQLVHIHNGKMPSSTEELTALAGVGRKTANVVRTHIFDIPSIVVDTHVGRISYRLGFTKNTDPVKVEFDLMKLLPKYRWSRYNSQAIALGRTICKSQRPRCEVCFLKDLCGKRGVKK